MSILETILEAICGTIARIIALIFKVLIVDILGAAFMFFANTAYRLIITEGGFATFDGLTTFIQDLIATKHGTLALNTTLSAITIIVLAINIVFSGLKIMSAPATGKESESPHAFFVKVIISAILIFSYKYITNFVVDFLNAFTHNSLFSTEINFSDIKGLFGDAILSNDVLTTDNISIDIIGELITYAVLYIMLFKDLLFSAIIYVERYLSFAVYLLLGPICFAMYPNESTKNVTQEWIKGIFSQLMVMVLSMFLFRLFFLQLYLMTNNSNAGAIGATDIARGIVLIVLLNILKDSEQLVNMLGLRTIPSGDTAKSFVGGFVGMYGTAKMGMGMAKTIWNAPGNIRNIVGGVVGNKSGYDKKGTYINPRETARENAKRQTTQLLNDTDGKAILVDKTAIALKNAENGGGIVNSALAVYQASKEYKNGDFDSSDVKNSKSFTKKQEDGKINPMKTEESKLSPEKKPTYVKDPLPGEKMPIVGVDENGVAITQTNEKQTIPNNETELKEESGSPNSLKEVGDVGKNDISSPDSTSKQKITKVDNATNLTDSDSNVSANSMRIDSNENGVAIAQTNEKQTISSNETELKEETGPSNSFKEVGNVGKNDISSPDSTPKQKITMVGNAPNITDSDSTVSANSMQNGTEKAVLPNNEDENDDALSQQNGNELKNSTTFDSVQYPTKKPVNIKNLTYDEKSPIDWDKTVVSNDEQTPKIQEQGSQSSINKGKTPETTFRNDEHRSKEEKEVKQNGQSKQNNQSNKNNSNQKKQSGNSNSNPKKEISESY